ncbi:hypothetical protein WJX72_002031 [[Myrmecia] bisecta]|uniref:Uncharacterized protein n=1 Tax=[Myrmecia] bisecta TaxID=41462 RepID=A0AAW1PTZ7_9CHLO
MEKPEVVELHCGAGTQILQWVGCTACARLAYVRGEVMGRYVPQSIMTAEGQVLDIHIVLNEMFKDGDELRVEYSDGPVAYKARWEGRPVTPPFEWGDGGEVVPPHDAWLRHLDMRTHELDRLVDPDLAKQAGATERDLQAAKDMLYQNAGALQAVFTLYEFQGEASVESVSRMNLVQFRALTINSKLVTAAFAAEKVDEIFTLIAASARGTNSKLDSSGVANINFLGFLIGLVHIAFARATAINAAGPALPMSERSLAAKLEVVISGHLAAYVLPDLSKKVDRFAVAYTPGAKLLLQKGRRLTEQTLNSCRLKRVLAPEVRVELKYLCSHLIEWKLLGKEFTFADLAVMVLFAKQPTGDAERFVLQPHPLNFNYDEFERLLVAITYFLYMLRKRKDPIEEYLGEMMDYIYRKAGVLQTAARNDEDQ